ncbi:phosphotransferase [Photobacterium sp. SDRW27]|uniref:phosphotransferase n=1 Tax=Photobacterium obscurum TaxID=2829490 RepID=UPI0022434DEB|nr:phosphotransferase [Photobacterium obscurum]MCW8327293.1 phosphotransferase [Photobacterium obscurum]
MNTFDSSLLGALPDLQLLSARPLSGGLSNRCWVLEFCHRRTSETLTAVWRPKASSAEAFGLSRRHEFLILNSLQAAAIAPNSIALLEHGLLVEWVEGKMADEKLSAYSLLQVQAEIHALPVPQWRLDVQEKAAHYWQYIPAKHKSPQLKQVFDYFRQHPPQLWFADTCCHHDLGRYNIICQPDGHLRVIDWEYAAAGDPSLDLALTINANQLDIEPAVMNYCQLRDRQDGERWLAAVKAWQPWCDYLSMLWFYVGATLWPEESSYLSEGLRLQRKLAVLVA